MSFQESQVSTSERSRTPWWQRIALMLGGVGLAVLLMTGLVAAFPGLMPTQTGKDVARSQSAGQATRVVFRYLDGDLFAWMPGRIRPPDEDRALVTYTINWDEDGFRVPAQTAERYPIVALGDSFTEGPNVPLPWPDQLAENLGRPVRNLGYRGYGPQENADVAATYMGEDGREWVLYGHFSGNDVLTAQYDDEDLIQERSPFFLIPFLAESAQEILNPTPAPTPDPDQQYDFPMPVIVADQFYEMALLDDYLWWQLAPEAGFEGTLAWQRLRAALTTIEDAITPTTCRAVIFIPTKPQLYYPYIHAGPRQFIRQQAQRPVVNDETGWMTLEPYPVTAEEEADQLIADFGQQRDALARLAAEEGWRFIDLLPAFQQAAAEGDLLYYRYDTHWNQAGHALAAEVIAEAMRTAEGCG